MKPKRPPQTKFYGIEIPVKIQPKCARCHGHMSINIMKGDGFWYCLSSADTTFEDYCEGESEQIDLADWLETAPPNIQEHLNTWLEGTKDIRTPYK